MSRFSRARRRPWALLVVGLTGLLTIAMTTDPEGALTPTRERPLAGQAPGPATPAAAVTAFVNVGVVPMDTERVLREQTVVVTGGRITALGPSGKVGVSKGAVRVDGRGKFLIPGIADMHAHIELGRIFVEDALKPADRLALQERKLFLWLARGMTTVRVLDHGSETRGEAILQARARAAAGEILSPRIYNSGNFWGVLARADSAVPPQPTRSPHQTLEAALTAFKAAGYDFIKVHSRTRFHEDDSLAALVRRAGLPLDGHAYGSLERVFAHYRSIEHLTGYLRVTGVGEGSMLSAAGIPGSKQADLLWDASGTWKGSPALSKQMSADSLAARIRELAVATQRAGVWNCPTLVNTIENWGGSGLPVQQQIVRALGEAGAGLLAGTDALQTPRNLDYFKKIGVAVTLTPAQWRLDSLYGDAGATHREFQAFVDAGLTPYQALATGTRNVAAFFGRLASTGTITVGKRADLVLLAGNPLADIRQTERIAGVMLGGRWLDRAELDRRIGEIDAWSTRWCAAAGQVRRGVVKLIDRVEACPTVASR